jgi:hypothetical protein
MENIPASQHLSIRELFAIAIHSYRKNLFPATIISIVCILPISLANLSIESWAKSPLTFVWSFLIALMSIILGNISSGALIAMFEKIYLSQNIKISEALQTGAKYVGTMVGASFTQGFAIGIPVLCIFSFFAITGFGNMGFVVSSIIVMPYIMFLLIRWGLTNICIVCENTGVQGSLKRSWKLTKRFYWRVLAVWLLNFLLNTIVGILPAIIFGYRFGNSLDLTKISVILGRVWISLAPLITLPLSRAINIELYHDLRARLGD